jgi:hypothetical protein
MLPQERSQQNNWDTGLIHLSMNVNAMKTSDVERIP